MQFTVYRQGSKKRPEGYISYKGEDALPYVGDGLFMVADGMGGAASIRHTKFNEDMFDEDKLVEVLFDGVIDNYQIPEFSDYVKKSFFEFFAVKDYYFKNIHNIKKSGYFGSRIATALMLHEYLSRSKLYKEELFDSLNKVESKEQMEAALKEIAAYFSKYFLTKMSEVSKKANLIYEGGVADMSLLGTTLCVTFFREKEEYVEAIYLVTGDSRPYFWDENGLSQVVADQEHADGSMTNYIRINEGAKLSFACQYRRFAKPCVLFNSSDGCFDCFPATQMGYEKLLLESIVSSENTQEVSQKLHDTFLTLAKSVDDSSTIALKTFGYSDFDALKAAAGRRLATLQSEYFEKLQDILICDYAYLYSQAHKTIKGTLAGYKKAFEKTQAVKDYTARYMQTHAADMTSEIENRKKEIAQQRNGQLAAIRDIICRNYCVLLPLLDKKCIYREIKGKLRNCGWSDNESAKHLKDLKSKKESFDRAIAELKKVLEYIYQYSDPNNDFVVYNGISIEVLNACEESMAELSVFFEGLKTKKAEAEKKICELRENYYQQNIQKAKGEPDNVMALCRYVQIEREKYINAILVPEDADELAACLVKLAELKELDEQSQEDAGLNAFWDQNYELIMMQLVLDDPITLNQQLLALRGELPEDEVRKLAVLKKNSELRARLLEAYEVGYTKYIKE